MSLIVSERYACHPQDFKHYDTERIRKEFLVEELFRKDDITLVYSLYDRFIVGGAMPIDKPLLLETFDSLKSGVFLERRELGIINVGGDARIKTSDSVFDLGYKEALYLGSGCRDVLFESVNAKHPAQLYLNSAPAHATYPSKKITKAEAEVVEIGSSETSNHRVINKLIVNSILPTCQLQMGMTELRTGSVWNTMPPHTHNRRMEAYFYFEVPDGQSICHYMGQTHETRHIWMQNKQAVFSPSWSIHTAAGTSNYTFIWGMAGENLDYGDMDGCLPAELK